MRVEMYQNDALVVVIEAERDVLRKELCNIILDYIKYGPVEVRLGKTT